MLILFGVDLNFGFPIFFPIFPIGSITVNLGRTLFSQKRNWRSMFRSTLYLHILSVHDNIGC
jgi:hypothetical protein